MPTAVGLFAGIGGIEEGLRRAGWQTILLCEIDPAARGVLRKHFPGIRICTDIEKLTRLPEADLVTAGFPCQDLSQAGTTKGINGRKSRLVREVFRLLGQRNGPPKWVLLENVPFMLQLDGGRAMRVITNGLEELGYTWAYRTVDARAFGLPQRRRRVLILASRTEDPRNVLLSDDIPPIFRPAGTIQPACGFYWTEGNTGLGWAVDAVPALKAGSTISIPSPPAIWLPLERKIITPDVRDAERLQGLPVNWTRPAVEWDGNSERERWRLIGNAVNLRVSKWIGQKLLCPGQHDTKISTKQDKYDRWEPAGWGRIGERYSTNVSEWPVQYRYRSLVEFLAYEGTALSSRAASGFLQRARSSKLRFQPGFLEDIAFHIERTNEDLRRAS